MSRLCVMAVVLMLSTLSGTTNAALSNAELAGLRFDQNIGTRVPLDIPFRDETGKAVRLGDHFGRKPVILVLGYFGCPMLCTLINNGLIESLQDLKMDIGNQFDVLNVSIDPNEQPALAATRKREYLRRYGRDGAADGWHFLIGSQSSIAALAGAAGFHYAYDPEVKQFAHPSGVIVLTPDGTISRYLFGVTFSPTDMRTALLNAAASKTGSPVEQFFFLCFHYSPITGKYGMLIMNGVRFCAAATLLALAGWMFVMFRRDRGRQTGRLEA